MGSTELHKCSDQMLDLLIANQSTDFSRPCSSADLQAYAEGTNGLFAHVDDAGDMERAFENLALGTTKGQLLAEVKITGGLFLPFSTITITITLDVRAGGESRTETFNFIVPLNERRRRGRVIGERARPTR